MEADRDLMPPPSLMGPPKIAPKSKLPTESKTVETTPSKQEESPAPPTPPPLLYEVPFWDSKPIHKYQLEVLKNGTIVETLDIFDKGHYLVGRLPICDITNEHNVTKKQFIFFFSLLLN